MVGLWVNNAGRKTKRRVTGRLDSLGEGVALIPRGNIMGITSKKSIARRHVAPALFSGLAVVALHLPAVAYAESAGFNLSHRLATKQTAGAVPIAFGQTVNGVLGDGTDPNMFEDGTPYDTYTVNVQTPGQVYLIITTSPEIPLVSQLYFFNAATGGFIGQQVASVFAPGQTVAFAGAFPQAGIYEIDVYPADLQQPAGTYDLALTDLSGGTTPPPPGTEPAPPPAP